MCTRATDNPGPIPVSFTELYSVDQSVGALIQTASVTSMFLVFMLLVVVVLIGPLAFAAARIAVACVAVAPATTVKPFLAAAVAPNRGCQKFEDFDWIGRIVTGDNQFTRTRIALRSFATNDDRRPHGAPHSRPAVAAACSVPVRPASSAEAKQLDESIDRYQQFDSSSAVWWGNTQRTPVRSSGQLHRGSHLTPY